MSYFFVLRWWLPTFKRGCDAFGMGVDSGPFSLTFFATTLEGISLSTTVTVDSFLTLKSYNLDGLQNVTEVNWFQGDGGPQSPTHQFTNLAVDSFDQPSVPEPTTLSLLGMLSLKLGRSIRWDADMQKIIEDDEANRMLKREYRAPWTYPVVG